jgi:hypothetical protein
MARKLRSKKGSAIYAQRKAIVEPVNGQIKEGRGLRRFLLRGLEKVDGEWHLIAAMHNLLKLLEQRRSQQRGRSRHSARHCSTRRCKVRLRRYHSWPGLDSSRWSSRFCGCSCGVLWSIGTKTLSQTSADG